MGNFIVVIIIIIVVIYNFVTNYMKEQQKNHERKKEVQNNPTPKKDINIPPIFHEILRPKDFEKPRVDDFSDEKEERRVEVKSSLPGNKYIPYLNDELAEHEHHLEAELAKAYADYQGTDYSHFTDKIELDSVDYSKNKKLDHKSDIPYVTFDSNEECRRAFVYSIIFDRKY